MKRKTAGITIAIVIFLVLFVARSAGMEWGNLFSLGQFLIDATLFPFAIYSFVMAAEEFRKAQEKPDLDLYWETDTGRVGRDLTFQAPGREFQTHLLRPALLNNGNAVGVWYMVRFNIPKEIETQFKQPIIGNIPENWRNAHSDDEYIFTFLSNGQYAAFPGYSLLLCDLAITLKRSFRYKREYVIPYTIVTGWGQRQDSSLRIKVE